VCPAATLAPRLRVQAQNKNAAATFADQNGFFSFLQLFLPAYATHGVLP
jgi:hypothetical protein